MSPERWYKVTGSLSLLIGLMASLCIYKLPLVFYGIPLALAGFILSGVNIFLQTKHNFEEGKFAKGYLGMLLSSLPVLFLMFVIFKSRPS